MNEIIIASIVVGIVVTIFWALAMAYHLEIIK